MQIDVTITDKLCAVFGQTESRIDTALRNAERDGLPDYVIRGLKSRKRQVQAAWEAFQKAGE